MSRQQGLLIRSNCGLLKYEIYNKQYFKWTIRNNINKYAEQNETPGNIHIQIQHTTELNSRRAYNHTYDVTSMTSFLDVDVGLLMKGYRNSVTTRNVRSLLDKNNGRLHLKYPTRTVDRA